MELIFGFLGGIIGWLGFITIFAMILGTVLPLIYKDTEDIDMRIGVSRFTLIHITKKESTGQARITIFHKHENKIFI